MLGAKLGIWVGRSVLGVKLGGEEGLAVVGVTEGDAVTGVKVGALVPVGNIAVGSSVILLVVGSIVLGFWLNPGTEGEGVNVTGDEVGDSVSCSFR